MDSLFYARYKGLNIVKQENEGLVTYPGSVNSPYEMFKLGDLSIYMLKCLIFVQGLTAANDKDIWCRIFIIMGQEPEIELQKVTKEC